MSDLKESVRAKYAALARAVQAGAPGSCCTSSSCSCGADYRPEDLAGLPPELFQASLGCGNPTALASLRPGEVVLDLGSGAGLDVFLAARQVGPGGKVYGLDMTEEMLNLAREYQRRSGIVNVEFLHGEMEEIPLPDEHVDVIISNCVLNLSMDKAKVLKEAYRVLKPSGRLAVSDLVWRRPVPAWLRHNAELWAGCIAGALTEDEYRRLLAEAGFTGIEVEVTRTYSWQDLPAEFLSEELAAQLAPYAGSLVSAFIRARKPTL